LIPLPRCSERRLSFDASIKGWGEKPHGLSR
jgi:hypothetical protein